MIGRKKDSLPEIRCMVLGKGNWEYQCELIHHQLKQSKTTFIISIKDLLLNEPIIAKRVLQTLTGLVKSDPKPNIAALSRDMLVISPFKIKAAE